MAMTSDSLTNSSKVTIIIIADVSTGDRLISAAVSIHLPRWNVLRVIVLFLPLGTSAQVSDAFVLKCVWIVRRTIVH